MRPQNTPKQVIKIWVAAGGTRKTGRGEPKVMKKVISLTILPGA
jgi:hypothetical protein